MTLEPFVIEGFGGMNVTDDWFKVGATGARDLVNVDFDTARGGFRCRDGFAQVKALTATSADGFATFESTAGLKQFVVGYQNGATKKYEAYGAAGGAAVASATPNFTELNAVRFGTPTNEYLYIANGQETIWRWTGAAFSQPAGMPQARYLAVDANSNRLVAAVTTNGVSSIEWSDPGLPETWTASNRLQLTPGDGSWISGLASWQDYVFAFKNRRFFVFTGESTDADGLPIFNYRTVDGYGALVPPVAGDEGVYFFDGSSVWLTTGDVPARVSRPVDPILRGTSSNIFRADDTLLLGARLSYSRGRLYLTYAKAGASGAKGSLVFDPKRNTWTFYDIDVTFLATLRRASTDTESTFAFGSMGGSEQVMYLAPSTDSDPTGDVPWSYQSGAYSVGPPERTAVIQDSSVVGFATGGSTSTLAINTDRCTASSTIDLTTSLFLGDTEAWAGADCEGRRWIWSMSGTGSTEIERITHYVSFVKPAGVE